MLFLTLYAFDKYYSANCLSMNDSEYLKYLHTMNSLYILQLITANITATLGPGFVM